jgi:hypothetical protein
MVEANCKPSLPSAPRASVEARLTGFESSYFLRSKRNSNYSSEAAGPLMWTLAATHCDRAAQAQNPSVLLAHQSLNALNSSQLT